MTAPESRPYDLEPAAAPQSRPTVAPQSQSPAAPPALAPLNLPAAPPAPADPFAPYPQYYPYPYAPPRPTNGMAIASMVLGIVWLYGIGSILALVFGYVARREIRRTGQSGDGMAIAGIVLGWIGVTVLSLVLFGVIMAATD